MVANEEGSYRRILDTVLCGQKLGNELLKMHGHSLRNLTKMVALNNEMFAKESNRSNEF